MFGSLAFEWTATSSEVKEVAVVAHVAFTQGDADAPTVRLTGQAAFMWSGRVLVHVATHVTQRMLKPRSLSYIGSILCRGEPYVPGPITGPCVGGAAIAFSATVDVSMGAFVVHGAVGNASVACGAPSAGAPTATVSFAIDRLGVDVVFLTAVLVHADLFIDDRGTAGRSMRISRRSTRLSFNLLLLREHV